MKRIIWIATLLLMVCANGLFAQKVDTTYKVSVYEEEELYEDDPYFWSYTKEVGINFTPLISKLVPFNLGQNEAGNVGLKWKKYYATRAFRFNFGANLSDLNGSDNVDNFFYIAVGIEKRYPISKDKKLSYSSGWDLFLGAQESDDFPVFGIAKTYGFEYHMTKRIFFSTESQFNMGLGGNGILFEFKLPVAIFVNVRLY